MKMIPKVISLQQAIRAIINTKKRNLPMLMIRLIQIGNNTNPILINQIINPRMRIGGIAQNQPIALR